MGAQPYEAFLRVLDRLRVGRNRGVVGIVSLLPSATESLFALGLGDQVVAITHECDYPPEAASLPIVTRSTLQLSGRNSSTIDAEVSLAALEGVSLLRGHRGHPAALEPDLVVAQDICDVCAIPADQVARPRRNPHDSPASPLLRRRARRHRGAGARLRCRLDRADEEPAHAHRHCRSSESLTTCPWRFSRVARSAISRGTLDSDLLALAASKSTGARPASRRLPWGGRGDVVAARRNF